MLFFELFAGLVYPFSSCFFFFFNDTATTEIYTLSLHDALPISRPSPCPRAPRARRRRSAPPRDRKSTRLNSSHGYISYAVFCLKKKKTTDLCLTEPSNSKIHAHIAYNVAGT